jgi:hypothetical protein
MSPLVALRLMAPPFPVVAEELEIKEESKSWEVAEKGEGPEEEEEFKSSARILPSAAWRRIAPPSPVVKEVLEIE